MNDSIAKIISAILVGLGTPPRELLSPKEVAHKVLAILARRLVQLSQSDQNQIIQHKTIYPATREYSLAGVTESGSGHAALD
jgi:hypothetical protein